MSFLEKFPKESLVILLPSVCFHVAGMAQSYAVLGNSILLVVVYVVNVFGFIRSTHCTSMSVPFSYCDLEGSIECSWVRIGMRASLCCIMTFPRAVFASSSPYYIWMCMEFFSAYKALCIWGAYESLETFFRAEELIFPHCVTVECFSTSLASFVSPCSLCLSITFSRTIFSRVSLGWFATYYAVSHFSIFALSNISACVGSTNIAISWVLSILFCAVSARLASISMPR